MGDDPIGFDDRARTSWERWLMAFEATVYPTFSKYGYSRNTALQAFLVNQLINAVSSDVTE